MPVHKECHARAQQNTDEALLKSLGFESSNRDNREKVREKIEGIMKQSPLKAHISMRSILDAVKDG
jgi:hypothetical protein